MKSRILNFGLDSLVLSLSKSLDEMVLPGKEASWEHNKRKWFVLDTATQLREPGKLQVDSTYIIFSCFSLGLLKSEFAITKGTAIFLSPKCYMMDNGDPNDPKGSKRALKVKLVFYYIFFH